MEAYEKWCRTCQAAVRIVDWHEESYYDGGSGGAHEYAYIVYDLACGHDAQSGMAEVGPAPGDQTAPAGSTWDRQRAHEEEG